MNRWLLPLFLTVMIAFAWYGREDWRRRLLGTKDTLTSQQILETSAGLVFRRGSLPDVESQAREYLRLNEAIRQGRLRDSTFHSDVHEAVAWEMQSWRRQWENDDERRQRLIGQSLTENEMEHRVREYLLDQAWLEQQIAAKCQVTRADLKTAFESQHDELKLPQAHHVAHLFLSRLGADKKDLLSEIQAIQQKLLTGGDWTELVQTYSEDARSKLRNGDLGWITNSRMPPAFIGAVETLKIGEISKPVSTPLGWHLIRVLERLPARPLKLEEVQSELLAELEWEKRREATLDLTRRLLDPLASGLELSPPTSPSRGGAPAR